jgi:hypothetical protein
MISAKSMNLKRLLAVSLGKPQSLALVRKVNTFASLPGVWGAVAIQGYGASNGPTVIEGAPSSSLMFSISVRD